MTDTPQAPPNNSRQRRIHKRTERDEVIARQREQFRRRQRNKAIFNYTILGVLALAILYGVYVYLESEDAGQYDALAQCLAKKGAVMYGTEWCPHCQEQKRLFGQSFRDVPYVNCDLNADACKAAGVEGYPTWTFSSGQPLAGSQPLAVLAERTDCVVE